MREVYTLNLQLEIASAGQQRVESLFPSGDAQTPERYFRDLKGLPEAEGLWRLFDSLFGNDVARELLRWGAVSIIKEERKATATGSLPYYRYIWRYWMLSDRPDDRAALGAFILEANDVTRNPRMVLPASLAENAFAVDEKYQTNPRALLVLPDDATLPECDHFFTALRGHLDDAPERWFPASQAFDPAGWKQYVQCLTSIAHKDEAVIYLPAVTFSVTSRRPLLAGGAVFCVKPQRWPEALKLLPEVQLYLRWVFSELLKFCRIGHEADWVEFVEGNISRAAAQGWFSDAPADTAPDWAKHNWSDISAEREAEALSEARELLGFGERDKDFWPVDGAETWEIAKLLVLGVARRPTRANSLIRFLKAALAAIRPDIRIDVGELSGPARTIRIGTGHRQEKESKAPARTVLFSLLRFLSAIPRRGQSFQIDYRELKDARAITFTLKEGAQIVDARRIVSAWTSRFGGDLAVALDKLNQVIAVDATCYDLEDHTFVDLPAIPRVALVRAGGGCSFAVIWPRT
jgi:hypothetical protein